MAEELPSLLPPHRFPMLKHAARCDLPLVFQGVEKQGVVSFTVKNLRRGVHFA